MMDAVALDRLVGLSIRSSGGRRIGRIAGIVAHERDGECVIAAVEVNSFGFAGRVMRWTLNAFKPKRWRSSRESAVATYEWERIDWSDWNQLRLLDA